MGSHAVPSSQVPPVYAKSTRTRVTNGKDLFHEVDKRTFWVRRMRDVVALHVSDLGGADVCSEAEKSVVRRVATLTIEMERMEHVFAQIPQETTPSMEMLCVYSRLANTLRRLLDMTGLQRRPRDLTPTIDQYVAEHALDDEDAEDQR